jgi:protoporphyrinogen oxidase
MTSLSNKKPVIIIGGGFGGLAAAYELALRGRDCVILEQDSRLGGLAGTFESDGVELEKFYHHWFASDRAVLDLVEELGLADGLIHEPTNTGAYYANSIHRLSTPADLLRFSPLPLTSRLRTGFMAAAARMRNDYRPLEKLTAAEWVKRLAGEKSYEVLWRPLLEGKFGRDAESISAVWLWGKFKLRGGSRDRRQRETLVYLDGGFGRLISTLRAWLVDHGVEIKTASPVREISEDGGRVRAVRLESETIRADLVLSTAQIPDLIPMAESLPADYRQRLSRIRYYGAVCLVLLLDRSLSQTYWINVNDPEIPFVGVIEHTNFIAPEKYGGSHVVYLAKYAPSDSELFSLDAEELLNLYSPSIRKMFPAFERSWVKKAFAWRADHAQPLIERNYSSVRPEFRTPLNGLWLSTMAHIYPEDRGTNYAVAYGRRAASEMLEDE